MARTAPSDEQLQLRRRARRRLIGAMALVTVIAVVLPWILESEPKPAEEEISIQIPSPDTGSYDPRTQPDDRTAKPAAEPAGPADPGAGQDGALKAEQDRVLAPERAAVQEKSAAVSPEPKKKADKGEATESKQFVVQVAALADADKARGIQQELSAKGLKAYTEKVRSGNGEVTRVRIGPFPSREAAEKERARLKTLGFEGNVAPR